MSSSRECLIGRDFGGVGCDGGLSTVLLFGHESVFVADERLGVEFE